MSVITVSHQLGSMGEEIAKRLSATLGYGFVDKRAMAWVMRLAVRKDICGKDPFGAKPSALEKYMIGSLKSRETVFQVTDLKQYTYCPRVVFFAYCLPLIRPMTYKMEAGIAAHNVAEEREQRRSLRRYGLTEGERFFDLWLASEALGLRGRVDLAIRTITEAIPVEYKNSPGRAGRHLKLQLAAYGRMLEEE